MNNNITEKVERYNEIGQVVRVSLKWRGKTYMLQMFFPGSKFPSRQEVEAQVKKIYPDSVVMVHYASETQPNQPLIRVSEGTMVAKKKTKMNPKNMTIPANQPYSGPDYRRLTASHEPDGEMVQETPYGEITSKRIKKTTTTNLNTERTPAKDDPSFSPKYKEDARKAIKASKEKTQTNSYQPEGEVVNEEESQNPTFTQFMKRIDQLPEVTREAIKNCGNDPMIAKAALEISGIDK